VELKQGTELPPHQIGPFTEADFVRFAGASGDFNPLHFDESFVKEAGYPGLFAMGLLPCGALVQYLATAVGQQNVRSVSVRFTALVFVDDTLTLSGRVESVGDADTAEVALAATRQTGEVAIAGTASVAIG
jgi:acyl dehydratase